MDNLARAALVLAGVAALAGAAVLAAYLRLARAVVEAELRRTLIEAAVSPLISVDARGKVVDFNRAAELAFGRQEADVVGQPVALLLDPESLIAAQRKAFRD